MKSILRVVLLFSVLILPSLFAECAENYFVRGIVRDSLTNEPVASVFVSLDNTSRGTMTDKDGIFEMTVPDKGVTLVIRTQGYATKKLKIARNRVNLYAIYLSPEAVELGEVVIHKKKYSKRNNPAVDLMEHIRRTAKTNDPANKPYYSYRTFQKTTVALNNISPTGDNGILHRFPELIEHLDTSEITGKPILPVMLRQQASETFHRSDPRDKHTIVTGKQSEGIDEILDKESMDVFFNDILGPVDIYARDINILQNRFVSPLSPIAADFYKYYLTDSLLDAEGRKYYVLSFYPHNKAAFGFTGTMEVTSNDSSAFVRKIEMRIPSEINLNFIESLNISQSYEEAPDGSRLKTSDDMVIEAVIIPGTQGLFARRNIKYSDHSFEPPENELMIFRSLSPVSVAQNVVRQDSVFWREVNPDGLSRGESKVSLLMSRLRSHKIFFWGEKVIKVLVTGYIPTRKADSKFDVGPMNTTISANDLEGLRLRAGGMTTGALSPHFFSRFYTAYGFKDHRWKYGVELEYSFNEKGRHSREFPIHSLRLNSIYDTDRPGQQYLFTNPDNVFLSLHRPGIDPMTYHRLNSLTYTLELPTHFSIKASINNERQYASSEMNFDTSGGSYIRHFDETWGDVELRYAPGEKFYQTASNRFPISLDAPVFLIYQKYGSRSKFGNFGSVNSTEVSFRKRFWLSAFGFIDVIAKGGHVWSAHTPFNHLFIANTNLSYTIQPESFALTAPMEFVADSYGMLDLTYWANGAMLNFIPGVKKAKLREAFSLRGFYGSLTARNDPAVTDGLIMWPGCQTTAERLHTPYLEASVGLDNILRCLRVDYVWRLTHRHSPVDGASLRGVRIAFHATF